MMTKELRDSDGMAIHPTTTMENVMTKYGNDINSEILDIKNMLDGMTMKVIPYNEYHELDSVDNNIMYVVRKKPEVGKPLPKDIWEKYSDLETLVCGSAAVGSDIKDKIYILGQNFLLDNYNWNKFIMYDPRSRICSVLPNMPTHPDPVYGDGEPRGNFENVFMYSSGDYVFTMSHYTYKNGYMDSPSRMAKKFDTVTNTWINMPIIPGNRWSTIAFDKLAAFIVGGSNSVVGTSESEEVYIYNLENGDSMELTKLPIAVGNPYVEIIDNIIYVIGGFTQSPDSEKEQFRGIQIYDIILDTWRILDEVFPVTQDIRWMDLEPRSVKINNTIYMNATNIKFDGSSSVQHSALMSYDTKTEEFNIKASMPVQIPGSDAPERLVTSTIALVGSNIYGFGASENGDEFGTDTNIYRYGGDQ